jgi:predicted XRE-type DNA-binding protein
MKIWQNTDLENLPDEVWKDVINYEGLYQISNMGRIKSLPRNSRTKIVKDKKILKLKQIKGDYIQVKLCKNSIAKMRIVSRLVAEHFLQKPDYTVVANHINSIRDDNRVENLEWISQSENIRYSYKFGKASQKGEKNNNSKITQEIANNIRDYFENNKHLSQNELAKIFGLKREHIKDIINFKTWK